MGLLIRWLIMALTLFMIPHLVHGVYVAGFGPALAAALVLSVLNFTVRPVLILLTLPLTLFTLGFFLLVINALMFELVGYVVEGFHVDSFLSALIASIITTAVSWVLHLSIGSSNGRRVIVVRQERRSDVIDV